MTVPVLPEWASNDEIDPISGQNNVVEPPTEKKQYGWAYREKPNRQYTNWLGRQTYECLSYLYNMFMAPTGTFLPVINDVPTYTIQIGQYRLIGDMCQIYMKINWTANPNLASDVFITNLPFPAKNVALMNQTLTMMRGITAGTLIGKGNLKASIDPSNSTLDILTDDPTTGESDFVNGAGVSGEIIIQGYYFIEV